MERIAIIGLGLIGGSIGLALKRAGVKDIEIAGTARTIGTMSKAKRAGAIDVDLPSAAQAARGARLVIVASPILAIPTLFREMAPALMQGATVTDVASTKGAVARWANELLPGNVNFVGGHPMAGKENRGFDQADADLFRDKMWVIAPSVAASEGSVQMVVGLAQMVGADPVFMDPDEHDSYAAAISHLPLVLSSALFSMAFASAAWPELATLASSGFRDTTRLASGSPEMAHDIALTNRDNVIHWIERFQDELGRLKETLRSGEGKHVLETFTRAQLERDNFMLNGAPPREQATEVERVNLMDVMVGSKIAGYMRKQEAMLRDMESRTNDKRR